jgi:glyoxylase-like metal-dependent hydrolase (beta-lactamase superfamily II)
VNPNVSGTRNVAPDVDLVGTYLPLPGLGVLPVNAFVLRSEKPVLIDTGVVGLRELTLPVIEQLIDPSSLHYIYLTHTDADHIGALLPLLEKAPRARLVTTFLGMGKLGLAHSIAPERVFLLNPGQSLDLGDRKLVVGRPPTFDAPETTWVRDTKTGTLFSSDCFGALLSQPAERADAISEEELEAGIVAWAGIDAPWFHRQRTEDTRAELARIAREAPPFVLGSHLPPARGMTNRLVRHLEVASRTPPREGPDQAALESLLRAA